MPYFEVKVDCWYRREPRSRPRKHTRFFIVEADGQNDSIHVAMEFARKTAAFGHQWIAFEWRETSTVTLPLEIKP